MATFPTSTIPVTKTEPTAAPPIVNPTSALAAAGSEVKMDADTAAEGFQKQFEAFLSTESGKNLMRSSLGKPASLYAKPALKPPPTFGGHLGVAGNPAAGELNAEEWCEQMESYMTLTGIAELEKINFVKTYLTGAALAFLKVHLMPPGAGEAAILGLDNWRTFKSSLIRHFQPLNTAQYVRDQLRLCRQGQKTVGEYLADFTRLASQVPSMTKEERLGFFRFGLRRMILQAVDRKLGDRGRDATVTIEEAAMVAALEEAAINRAMANQTYAANAHAKSTATSSASPNALQLHHIQTENPFNPLNATDQEAQYENELKGDMEETKGQLNALTSPASNPGSAAIGPCYVCKKMGHLQRDCWYGPNGTRGGRGRGRGRGGGGRGWGRGGWGRGGRGRGGGNNNSSTANAEKEKSQGKD